MALAGYARVSSLGQTLAVQLDKLQGCAWMRVCGYSMSSVYRYLNEKASHSPTGR